MPTVLRIMNLGLNSNSREHYWWGRPSRNTGGTSQQAGSMEYTITEEKGKVSVVLASSSVLSLVLRQEEWVPPSAPSAHAHETHSMEQSLWMVNSSNSFLFHIRYFVTLTRKIQCYRSPNLSSQGACKMIHWSTRREKGQ